MRKPRAAPTPIPAFTPVERPPPLPASPLVGSEDGLSSAFDGGVDVGDKEGLNFGSELDVEVESEDDEDDDEDEHIGIDDSKTHSGYSHHSQYYSQYSTLRRLDSRYWGR
ncbi:hypothetical protein IFR04_007221 [Cadophora malorum]|uniref:Uncharacterized protein n=1 Tax=Cadophora malorum TaxID=108018 RepID=A0A8H7WB26_9HELO|nr:hypothetical protein IFR04_007221 [Cadophora malorum]